MSTLREDSHRVIQDAIAAVLPDEAVYRALKGHDFGGKRLFLVAIGKAGYQMARAAYQMTLPGPAGEAPLLPAFTDGIVVTKYGHVQEPLPGITCLEAGHPVPDENSYISTKAVIDMVTPLTADDTVLFLVSGGGSALFEYPLISGEEMQAVTNQLLQSGADITEMNTIRKRLSSVKGGKFAKLCAPAQIYSIVLSDIVGDPLDMIASGPAAIDTATCEDAFNIAAKYQLTLSEEAMSCLHQETPKELHNVETVITGSVRELCTAALCSCRKRGYHSVMLTDTLTWEASDAGRRVAELALSILSGDSVLNPFLPADAQTATTGAGQDSQLINVTIPTLNTLPSPEDSLHGLALVLGGETVVHLHGSGLGGRNQELVLSAAVTLLEQMDMLTDSVEIGLFSVGSDGTDGPTDAAGGYIDTEMLIKVQSQGIDLGAYLDNNDAYHALEQIGGLITTGPTGTNVNDVAVLFIRRKNPQLQS